MKLLRFSCASIIEGLALARHSPVPLESLMNSRPPRATGSVAARLCLFVLSSLAFAVFPPESVRLLAQDAVPEVDALDPSVTDPASTDPSTGDTAAKDATADDPATAEQRRKDREEEFRLLTLFADTFAQIKRNYAKDIDDRELMEAAIEGMLSKLDQYSNYISPTDMDSFKTGVSSEFGGVGIKVGVTEDGWLEIESPIPGTPAYRAGIRPGDRIVEIEGESARGFTIDDAVKKMKGKIGTVVSLKVVHRGGSEPESYSLKRELVRVPTVVGFDRLPNNDWNYFCDNDKKIAFIRLGAFGRHTTDELTRALDDLTKAGMRGLILDLRFNPGGLLTTAVEVSDLFLPSGVIVSTEGRNAPRRVWDAKKPGTFEGFPMAVLVNHFSASASEIVAASLQDHQRAIVVGERTWGKGSVQNIIELEEGQSALKLTTAGYFRPSGKNIHRFDKASEADDWGVRPDSGYEVKVEPHEYRDLDNHHRALDVVQLDQPQSPADRPKFNDRQLEKALEYLAHQLEAKEADDAAKPDDARDDQDVAAKDTPGDSE